MKLTNIPVITLNDLIKQVLEIAEKQWHVLKPRHIIMGGMVKLSTTNPTPEQIIEWFADKRERFDLKELPDTFVINYTKGLILISCEIPTYAEK